ncbi:MAG TPA: MarR family transcriptional regulator [Iamia sp.]|jgi:DNA-binding MarR family transcriptional regulator|nr:MarR family transcriptional regulator [Iamia sp.]
MAPPTRPSATVDAVVQLSFAIQARLATLAAGHDLSLTQLRALGALRDRRPTMQALAEHLGLTKSSLSGLIDRAEGRGLVRRVPDEADGRTVRVELTDEGRSAAATLTAAVNEAVDLLLEPLSATDRATITRIARRLTAPPPSPPP